MLCLCWKHERNYKGITAREEWNRDGGEGKSVSQVSMDGKGQALEKHHKAKDSMSSSQNYFSST